MNAAHSLSFKRARPAEEAAAAEGADRFSSKEDPTISHHERPSTSLFRQLDTPRDREPRNDGTPGPRSSCYSCNRFLMKSIIITATCCHRCVALARPRTIKLDGSHTTICTAFARESLARRTSARRYSFTRDPPSQRSQLVRCYRVQTSNLP